MFAALLLALPAAPNPVLTQDADAKKPRAETLTRAEMEADLDRFALVVSRAWSYVEDKRKVFDVDVPTLVAEARAMLPVEGSRAEFAKVLVELASALRDGHASVDVDGVKLSPPRWLPMELVDAREGVLVGRVHPAAAESGLRVGDELLAIGGVSLGELVATAERRVSASTDAARRRLALDRVRGTRARAVEARVRDAAGEERTVALQCLRASDDALWRLRPAKHVTWGSLDEDVGYLRVASFAVDDWERWLSSTNSPDRDELLASARERIDRAMAELVDEPALVIDLRGNGGGTDWLGIHLARHLLEPGFSYFTLETRYSPETSAANGELGRDLPEVGWSSPYTEKPGGDPPAERYRGRLFLLIDEYCFSTTDNFVACIADQHPNALLVGRPTHGGSGAPRELVTLEHSGAGITLCTMRVSRPNGALIESRGTVPDVPIQWTREDLVEGDDPDLEAAVARAHDALSR